MLQSATLSSASILLAILTALYGLFYPAIKEAIDLPVLEGARAGDNGANCNRAIQTFNGKALPLAVGAFLIAGVFSPELYKQILATAGYLRDYGFHGVEYDITSAAFMMVSFFTVFQGINIIRLAWKCCAKMKELKAAVAAVEAAKKAGGA